MQGAGRGISADIVVGLVRPLDPQVSPDGRWVAYTAMPYTRSGDHYDSAIWVAPTDGSADARQFTAGAANDHHPRWSPDSRSLAFLSDRRERGSDDLHLIDLAGGEARTLTERKAPIRALAWATDGRRIAFLAPDEPTEEDERREPERDDAEVWGERWRYGRVHVLDLDTGAVTTLATGDRHVKEVVWSPDGDAVALVAQPTPELESSPDGAVLVLPLDADGPREVCRHQARDLAWLADGRLLWAGWHQPEPQCGSAVWAMPAGGGEPSLAGVGPDASVCDIGVVASPCGRHVVRMVADRLTTRLEWCAPDDDVVSERSGGDIHQAALAVDAEGRTTLAVVASAGDDPPEVWAGPAGALRRVSDHQAPAREAGPHPQEPFRWASEDGLDLDGLLIRPADAPAGPLPTVMLLHGGPYGRYTNGYNGGLHLSAQWLASLGYAVLMPNYRGGMGRGNAFARAASAQVGGAVGGAELTDAMTAVDAAIDRGIADPDRLGIVGWSQGGFLTAWAATQSDRFKAGVMGAGVSDWGMLTMDTDVPRFEAELGGSRPWDGPGPHESARRSPISYASQVSTPLLILHGKEDPRIPVNQARGFARALREHGAAHELVVYPREGHPILERNHQLDLYRRVREWYERWL